MERIRLYRSNRQKFLGEVILDQGQSNLLVDDQQERSRLQKVFDETGDVTWAWARFEDNEWNEHRAKPRTPNWLWFVVANILYPMGYQADFNVPDEGSADTS